MLWGQEESQASVMVLCQVRQEDSRQHQEGGEALEQEQVGEWWEQDALLSELVQSHGIATVIMGMDAETMFSLV